MKRPDPWTAFCNVWRFIGRPRPKRPRLTSGQWRAMFNLDYLEDRARYEDRPTTRVSVFAHIPPALLRHGYVRLDGAGYVITEAGRDRMRRRSRTSTASANCSCTPPQP
jgi:hypothetical protein